MIVLPKMDSLNLVMKKQKTNQIEGHSRKQAPHNIQRCQVYESQGKFVILFKTGGNKLNVIWDSELGIFIIPFAMKTLQGQAVKPDVEEMVMY